MASVTERLEGRTAAPAQRYEPAGRHNRPVGIADVKVAPQDEWAIRIHSYRSARRLGLLFARSILQRDSS
jgi:hypothetical protein